LKLGDEARERFGIWGISTLGELAALPETALITRMGQIGKQLRLRARGEMLHLLEPVAETALLEEVLDLDEPVETLEPLLFLLNPMLEQLILRAQGRALALASVTVELGIEEPADRVIGEDFEVVEPLSQKRDKGHLLLLQSVHIRTVRPAVPVLDRALLLKMLQLDLEAHPSPGAVIHVRLSAEAGDTSRIQLGLFAPQMPEPTRFEDTHARLVSLVGEGNVGRAKPLDTHGPEGFVLERFRLPEGCYKAPPVRDEGARPATVLRRMRPPIEVRVRTRGRQIAEFWYETRRYEVLRSYGPWRTSGDWWCGSIWSADTWDLAAVNEGEVLICLVGHDLRAGVWRMEGVYD
jgi:protein ImuB